MAVDARSPRQDLPLVAGQDPSGAQAGRGRTRTLLTGVGTGALSGALVGLGMGIQTGDPTGLVLAAAIGAAVGAVTGTAVATAARAATLRGARRSEDMSVGPDGFSGGPDLRNGEPSRTAAAAPSDGTPRSSARHTEPVVLAPTGSDPASDSDGGAAG
jgi:hypothetical protein